MLQVRFDLSGEESGVSGPWAGPPGERVDLGITLNGGVSRVKRRHDASDT